MSRKKPHHESGGACTLQVTQRSKYDRWWHASGFGSPVCAEQDGQTPEPAPVGDVCQQPQDGAGCAGIGGHGHNPHDEYPGAVFKGGV